MSQDKQKILFVTGRLAEPILRKVVERLETEENFVAEIQVLPISVAALMTLDWIKKRIVIADDVDRVILPGFCGGDFCGSDVENFFGREGLSIEVGPKDLRKLPQYFGRKMDHVDYGDHDIEIIAEINHAPRLPMDELISIAKHYLESGADVIDVGCEVDSTWNQVGDCVKALKDLGLRVSVDSMIPDEIAMATAAGAELVLSVNSSNIEYAESWGKEVVLIPDEPDEINSGSWGSLESNIERLTNQGISFRVDPILEPIGFGFAKSLQRYMLARERWPELPMMMGIGNLTEMTEVDSAGVNVLLVAICQELEIRSVLTTEVIPWAQSSVQECNIARQLTFHAIQNQALPKHIDSRLVSLRDPEFVEFKKEEIREIAKRVKDFNMRIFSAEEMLHLVGGGHHLQGTDPFELFDQLSSLDPKNLTSSHAFYLGYELAKAMIALNLGKEYVQDEALNWGHLTVDEKNRHRLSKQKRNS